MIDNMVSMNLISFKSHLRKQSLFIIIIIAPFLPFPTYKELKMPDMAYP